GTIRGNPSKSGSDNVSGYESHIEIHDWHVQSLALAPVGNFCGPVDHGASHDRAGSPGARRVSSSRYFSDSETPTHIGIRGRSDLVRLAHRFPALALAPPSFHVLSCIWNRVFPAVCTRTGSIPLGRRNR